MSEGTNWHAEDYWQEPAEQKTRWRRVLADSAENHADPDVRQFAAAVLRRLGEDEDGE